MFREVSVRKLASGLLYFLMIPMIVVVLLSTAYQAMNEQKYAKEQAEYILDMAAMPLLNDLNRVDATMRDLLEDNSATSALSREISTDQFYRNVYAVRTALQTVFHTSDSLDMMMFYFPESGVLLNKDEGFPNLIANDKLSIISSTKAKFMKDSMDDSLVQDIWLVEYMGDCVMLRYNVGYDNIYCAALFDLEEILKSIYSNYDENTSLYFLQDGLLVSAWPEDSVLYQNINEQGDIAYLGGEYNEITVTQDFMGLTLVCVSSYNDQFYGVEKFTLFLAGVSVLLLVVLIGFILVMRQRLILPMDRLVHTMERISQGNMDERAFDVGAGEELQQVNATFNQMIEHIQTLKIAQYEQQLELRQVQIQYYQAQIRPHFYLNCLKNLYSLAQQNEMRNIEQSILLLSNHLRYCFQWNTETVTLQSEIEMCKNYIDLMSVTAIVKPTLKLDIDDGYLNCAVPPVSLLTMVENCLKYGLQTDRNAVVTIATHLLDGGDATYLQLGVYDNGVGFGEVQLAELNELLTDGHRTEQTHVGIRNVLRRFELLYGARFNVAFSNQGGAAVEFFIEQQDEEHRGAEH